MLILKLIRKAGKFIRGGASPAQIASGALLGVFIGFIPGFNLSLLLGIGALIVFNVHLGTALIGIGIGKACSFMLAPVSFRTGYFIIHNAGLEGFFRYMLNAPVSALSGFDLYSVSGALPLVLLIGGAYAYAMIRVVEALRNILYKNGETRPFLRKITSGKPVAFLIKIVFGKKKEFGTKKPLVRKGGALIVALAVLSLAAVDLFAFSPIVKWGAASVLERLNGAEVNIGKATFSALRGKFVLQDLQVTDPARPEYNRIRIDSIAADLSMRDLWAKRIMISELSLHGLRTDDRRDKTGRVYEAPTPTEPEPEKDIEEPVLFDYFKDTERIQRIIGRTADALEKLRERSREREEQMQEPRRFIFETADNIGYRNTSASELLRRYPALTVKKASAGGISVFDQPGDYIMVISNISSNPLLSGHPTDILLATQENGDAGRLWVQLNLHAPDKPHELLIDIAGIPAGEGTGIEISEAGDVKLGGGSVDVNASGMFDTDMLDIVFMLSISDFELEMKEGKKLFGLDPELSALALSTLNTMAIYGNLHGRLRSPGISFDTSRTLAGIREGLRSIDTTAALKKLLESRAGDLDDENLRKLLEQEGEIRDALPRLFRQRENDGTATDEEAGDEDGSQEKEKLQDAIRSLF